jgi:SPP1 family predicted phage head-tail adaptor
MMTSRAFLSLLNRMFTISRRNRIPDGQGGWVISWAELGRVRGRARPASSIERETAQAEERELSHVLYVEAGTDIARGDLVESGDFLAEVMAVREPSLAGEHYEIDLMVRQREVTEDFGS